MKKRIVTRKEPTSRQGKQTRMSYQRGEVTVSFEPRPVLLGVSVRTAHPQVKTLEAMEQRLRLNRETLPAGVPKEHIHLLSLPSGADPFRAAEELAGHGAAIHVGQVVGLTEASISFMSGEAVVRFREVVNDAVARALLREIGADVLRVVPYSPNTFHIRLGPIGTYAQLDVLRQLNARPEVLWAEPNLVTAVAPDSVIPPDYLWAGVWDRQLARLPDAWQHLQDAGLPAYGQPSILLAIPDQGVITSGGTPTQPEFQGTLSDGRPKVAEFYDFVNLVANHDTPLGDHGMGTAGTSTALAGNASPIVGVFEGLAGAAPNVQLLAMIYEFDDTDVADMYIWAAGFNPNSPRVGFPPQRAQGADVFSSSIPFGTGAPISGTASAMLDFITTYGRGGKGCITFQSAGNNNIQFDPTYRPYGAYERSIAVGASTLRLDGTEGKAGYSDWGPKLGICAPSCDVLGGPHNPPYGYGVLSCEFPGSGQLPGHPVVTTNLSAAQGVGDTTIHVASTAGFVIGQRAVIGAVGSLGWEAATINSVGAAANTIGIASGLMNAHPMGTLVAAGPANGYRNNFGGTSSATPLTAGIAALILSANPNLTWIEVRQILRDTAVKIDSANTDPIGQWLDANGNPSVTSGNLPVFSQWYGYGRVDAQAAVQRALNYIEAQDIYVRDNLAETGMVPTGVPFWDSPDIWVRNLSPAVEGPAALPGSYASAGPHQNPVSGQDNWVYVRYKNRGTVASLDFYVRVYIAHYPGLEFTYPESFIPSNRPGTSVPSPMTPGTYLLGQFKDTAVGPGVDRIQTVTWPQALIPPADVTVGGSTVHWHPCLLVEVSPHDGPAATGPHVWDDNDLAQKNVTIIYAPADSRFEVAVVVGGIASRDRRDWLEIDRSGVPYEVRLYVNVNHPGVLSSLRELTASMHSNGGGASSDLPAEFVSIDEFRHYLGGGKVEYDLGFGPGGIEVAWLGPAAAPRIPLMGLGRIPHPMVVGGVVGPGTPKGEYRIQLIQRAWSGQITGGAAIDVLVGIAPPPRRTKRSPRRAVAGRR